jgi:hypothetical protein
VAVQPRAISPLAVEHDAVRRIRDHQDRLALTKEPCDIFRLGCIAAKHPMLSADPQVPDSGHRVFGQWWRGVCFSSSGIASSDMSLIVFDCKGIPTTRRERIETAVEAAGGHVKEP